MDFVSFLFQNLKKNEKDKIKSLILFGSVARGDAGTDSDVDIFIDIMGDEKKIERESLKLVDKFFGSFKFKKHWNLLGIQNEINIVVGKLEKWKLRDSMLGNSIILYQKYSPRLEEGKNKILLIWSVVKNNSKRVMLNKKLIGYNYYGRKYKGMLEIYEGNKLGSNVISIPSEHLNLFLKEFHKFKVNVKIIRVFEYKE
ncbi:MAG: nucleotidyltransferase domain-containing protein [Nanoarchaeota archaeon]|nr:nucleotidyltransferase domain-containing protein [Nanoarchaeota archaeon]